MKTLEIMKHKVRNAIKMKIGIVTFLLLILLSEKGFSQEKNRLSLDQHEIVNRTFLNSSKEFIVLNFQTMCYESWMVTLWSYEFLRKDGIGLCSFENERLRSAFNILRNSLKDLNAKTIDSNYLANNIKLNRKQKNPNLIFISEPIIIDEFSFHFLKSRTNKSLYVSKRNEEGVWDYECGVTIYGELH